MPTNKTLSRNSMHVEVISETASYNSLQTFVIVMSSYLYYSMRRRQSTLNLNIRHSQPVVRYLVMRRTSQRHATVAEAAWQRRVRLSATDFFFFFLPVFQ
jgi:hypothetical protein